MRNLLEKIASILLVPCRCSNCGARAFKWRHRVVECVLVSREGIRESPAHVPALQQGHSVEAAPEASWRVVLTRDSLFNGCLFVGARMSGVYCRPVCPAHTSNQENVELFPSAAAAQAAGFRPCLSCHPELVQSLAPGVPSPCNTLATPRASVRSAGFRLPGPAQARGWTSRIARAVTDKPRPGVRGHYPWPALLILGGDMDHLMAARERAGGRKR